MTQWQPVSLGRSGARVWRGDGRYRKQGRPTEIAAETERLRWLSRHGVPCPRVVSHADGVLVTDAVPGRALTEEWPPHVRPVLVEAYARLLHAVHSLPVEQCPFDSRLAGSMRAAADAVSAGEVELDQLDAERRGWSADRLLGELLATRPATEDLVVTHGDPTADNVVFDEQSGIAAFVDVGGLGVADRYRDLAIATRSVAAWGDRTYEARLLAAYGIEPAAVDEARITFYRLLDEFF